MADEFDRLLKSALQPPEGLPDRQFVARVQARIALEEQLSSERRLVVGGLIKQLLALAAVAAAIWWVGRAAPVASSFAESPALGLAILLIAFLFLTVVVSARPPRTVSTTSF